MPRRRITFRQLESFEAVARHRSFTRAADALHLTQPAISIHVRQIADVLGLPLFEQNGREVSLTPAGEELLETVRSLDDVWNRFESAIDQLKGLRRGVLRVALVTTAKYFLPRMLGAFCQRYPDIDIQLEIAGRDQIVARLRNNLDDLYVMSHPPADLDIKAYPFLDNEYVVIAPHDHWAVGQAVSLRALANEPFLLREAGSGSRIAIDEHVRGAGLTLKVRLSLASNEAIRDLVASGLGLAVLSRHALGDSGSQPGIAVLALTDFNLRRPWSVVHLRHKVLSLPAQAFLDALLHTGLSATPAPPTT
ncbi:LysR family transcriptional regulator [Niveibacterium umoris]|uniref:DNA-binding transcriptional LysR family regulator n=1 Tax=Niveibacterium umoris TaxID=1193620 RepID=A0A840BN81_9RHOO|nr:LysR substrate-binding domain-containing protein [Niveibacterium umoris]MBB4014024.1 DNA-binding transcriptional LysR family regulator [Niveibacterium umoris]